MSPVTKVLSSTVLRGLSFLLSLGFSPDLQKCTPSSSASSIRSDVRMRLRYISRESENTTILGGHLKSGQ